MSALTDRIAEVLRPCAMYGIDVDLLAERVAEALQLTEEHTCTTCYANYDQHSNDDLSCPAYTDTTGDIVFSETHKYRPPVYEEKS